MKKYETPSIKLSKFRYENLITASGEGAVESLPKRIKSEAQNKGVTVNEVKITL